MGAATLGCPWAIGSFLGAFSLTRSLLHRVAEVLEGRGAGKKGRFQGKATKMSRRAGAQALLQDHVGLRSVEDGAGHFSAGQGHAWLQGLLPKLNTWPPREAPFISIYLRVNRFLLRAAGG